jgi:hypothetical protein
MNTANPLHVHKIFRLQYYELGEQVKEIQNKPTTFDQTTDTVNQASQGLPRAGSVSFGRFPL